VTPEAALERARHVDEHVPTAAPLWGLPLADKDLHRRAGVPARFGSRAFADFVPDDSDELVRAVDAAGAVSVGKTATPEFGLPSYTEGLVGPPRAIPGTSRSARADRAAGRPRPWPPGCCRSRPAPTEVARSASPPRRAGSSA
jgi:amidase